MKTTRFAFAQAIAAMALASVLQAASAAVAAASDAAAAAPAGTVWRCGGDGRTLYSDAPCAGGRPVAAADPRSAEQVAQGRAVLAADLRRAEAMRRERLERERFDAAHAQRVPLALSAAAAPLKPAAGRQAAQAEGRGAKKGQQAQKPQKPQKASTEAQAAKPTLARARRPSSLLPAAAGTWQATAAASPRAPG